MPCIQACVISNDKWPEKCPIPDWLYFFFLPQFIWIRGQILFSASLQVPACILYTYMHSSSLDLIMFTLVHSVFLIHFQLYLQAMYFKRILLIVEFDSVILSQLFPFVTLLSFKYCKNQYTSRKKNNLTGHEVLSYSDFKSGLDCHTHVVKWLVLLVTKVKCIH